MPRKQRWSDLSEKNKERFSHGNIGSKRLVYERKAFQTVGGVRKDGIVKQKQNDGSYRYKFISRVKHGKKIFDENPAVQEAFKKNQYECK